MTRGWWGCRPVTAELLIQGAGSTVPPAASSQAAGAAIPISSAGQAAGKDSALNGHADSGAAIAGPSGAGPCRVEGALADEVVIGEDLSVLQPAAGAGARSAGKGAEETAILVTVPDWCRCASALPILVHGWQVEVVLEDAAQP